MKRNISGYRFGQWIVPVIALSLGAPAFADSPIPVDACNNMHPAIYAPASLALVGSANDPVPVKKPVTKAPAKAAPAKSPASKAPATATPAKSSATKAPAKAAPAKSPATKAPAKAAPAKSSATKAPAKAAPAQSSASKAPAKAAPAQSSASKAPAKAAPAQSDAVSAGQRANPKTVTSQTGPVQDGSVVVPVSSVGQDSPGEEIHVAYGKDFLTIRDGVLVEPVGLRQCMLLAINNSPALDAARARYEQAIGATNEARTGGNPTVDWNASYTHVLPEASASLGETKITTGYEHSYSSSLVLKQAIATFGRLHFGVLASKLNEYAVLEEYRLGLETLLTNAADLYLSCLMADEDVRIADQLLEARNSALKDAESLFEGGTVAKFDVLRYRSEATSARQTLIEAKNARKLAYAKLCSVMGFPQGTRYELKQLNMAVVPANLVEHVNFEARVEEALLCRPELRALGWARGAAEARLELIKSSLNPTFGLQSSVSYSKATSMSSDWNWTTGLVFSVPVTDGGVEKAQSEQLRAAIREIDANYKNTEREVRLDVENCYLNLSSRWERIIQANSGLEQASEACRVAEVRYAAGLSTSTELLDAQTALAEARKSLVVARYGYLAANVQWARAISGQYPVDVPGPIDPAAVANKGAAWYVDLHLPITMPESPSQSKADSPELEIHGGAPMGTTTSSSNVTLPQVGEAHGAVMPQ